MPRPIPKVDDLREIRRLRVKLDGATVTLVSRSAVAEILGVTRTSVGDYMRCYANMPAPVARVGVELLWDVAAVERFLVAPRVRIEA
jgi:hypothetical protein